MLILFALVSTRVAGLFIGTPALARRDVPARYRVALVLVISAALLPAVPASTLPAGAGAVLVGLASELLLGMSIGFVVRLSLTAFQVAGTITSTQMGLALGATFDPESGRPLPLFATIQLSLVTLLFLLLDAHHVLLRSLAASFEILPPGSPLPTDAIAALLSDRFQAMFELAARVAAPVSGLLLIVNGVVGFLNRVTPQLSIFNIGFPMTVTAGLVGSAISLPGLAALFYAESAEFESLISALLGF